MIRGERGGERKRERGEEERKNSKGEKDESGASDLEYSKEKW